MAPTKKDTTDRPRGNVYPLPQPPRPEYIPTGHTALDGSGTYYTRRRDELEYQSSDKGKSEDYVAPFYITTAPPPPRLEMSERTLADTEAELMPALQASLHSHSVEEMQRNRDNAIKIEDDDHVTQQPLPPPPQQNSSQPHNLSQPSPSSSLEAHSSQSPPTYLTQPALEHTPQNRAGATVVEDHDQVTSDLPSPVLKQANQKLAPSPLQQQLKYLSTTGIRHPSPEVVRLQQSTARYVGRDAAKQTQRNKAGSTVMSNGIQVTPHASQTAQQRNYLAASGANSYEVQRPLKLPNQPLSRSTLPMTPPQKRKAEASTPTGAPQKKIRQTPSTQLGMRPVRSPQMGMRLTPSPQVGMSLTVPLKTVTHPGVPSQMGMPQFPTPESMGMIPTPTIETQTAPLPHIGMPPPMPLPMPVGPNTHPHTGMGPTPSEHQQMGMITGPSPHQHQQMRMGMGPASHQGQQMSMGMGPAPYQHQYLSMGPGPHQHQQMGMDMGPGPHPHLHLSMGPGPHQHQQMGMDMGPGPHPHQHLSMGPGSHQHQQIGMDMGPGPYQHQRMSMFIGMGIGPASYQHPMGMNMGPGPHQHQMGMDMGPAPTQHQNMQHMGMQPNPLQHQQMIVQPATAQHRQMGIRSTPHQHLQTGMRQPPHQHQQTGMRSTTAQHQQAGKRTHPQMVMSPNPAPQMGIQHTQYPRMISSQTTGRPSNALQMGVRTQDQLLEDLFPELDRPLQPGQVRQPPTPVAFNPANGATRHLSQRDQERSKHYQSAVAHFAAQKDNLLAHQQKREARWRQAVQQARQFGKEVPLPTWQDLQAEHANSRAKQQAQQQAYLTNLRR